MTAPGSGQSPDVSDTGPGTTPLWSTPLPGGGTGLLVVDAAGGCVASVPAVVGAFTVDGRPAWRAAPLGRLIGGPPVIAPDGVIIRVEGDQIVARDPEAGRVVASFPSPDASGLAVAPWGDLVYSQASPRGVASVHCVSRTGQRRWSVPLGGSGPLAYPPIPVGDVVVIERLGVLLSFDRHGRVCWAVDRNGPRSPDPADGAGGLPGERTDGTDGGVRINATPGRLDADRVVLELAWYDGRGLYLLDAAGTLTPFAVPSPVRRPFAVLNGGGYGYRVAGLGSTVELARFEWAYPVRAFEPGSTLAWEHRLSAQPVTLTPTAGGGLVVAVSPTLKYWADYHEWQDLSRLTFVRLLDATGLTRWTWYAPGPLTHLPAVSPAGIIYVGAGERLWALPEG